MKPIDRAEILDYVTYDETRAETRAAVMAAKALRRVVFAEHLTLLFENRDTVRYQIQEMVRAEKLVREADIAHELRTYNELLGGPQELGATLLIGIENEAERDQKLRAWLALPQHVYLRLPDGSLSRPSFDPRQVGDDRLSSVQYFKFIVGDQAPIAVGVDLPGLTGETVLTTEQRAALQSDLDDS